jgi:hypothetical protein
MSDRLREGRLPGASLPATDRCDDGQGGYSEKFTKSDLTRPGMRRAAAKSAIGGAAHREVLEPAERFSNLRRIEAVGFVRDISRAGE